MSYSADCVIVGSGFCGSVIARKLAEEQNKRVLVLERRRHIAGNMFDEIDQNGILVQRYGPHIFHTNNDSVYQFITRYGQWNQFHLTCMVDMDGIVVPSPFNFTSIDKLYEKDQAETVKEHLIKCYPACDKVTIVDLLKCEDPVVRQYADLLFELDYRPYTAKQWGISPEQIDISVLKRVPVLLNYQNAYFDDLYQCMPADGFTSFFKQLLYHPNIEVRLNTDAMDFLCVDTETRKLFWNGKEACMPIVYTGAVDELMGFRYGRLPYRSLRFDYQTKYTDSFQPAPVVAYPKAEGFTRITEYKKLPEQKVPDVSTIAVEYPLPFESMKSDGSIEPYYPIPNDANMKSHNHYCKALEEIPNLYLCGRLADYKYYNMDDAIERAFEVYEKIRF